MWGSNITGLELIFWLILRGALEKILWDMQIHRLLGRADLFAEKVPVREWFCRKVNIVEMIFLNDIIV